MSSWLQRQASSHQVQLISTGLVSGLVVASTIFGVQAFRRKIAIEELKSSIPNVDETHEAETFPDFSDYKPPPPPEVATVNKEDERAAGLARRALAGDYDSELVQEQLTRTSSFLTQTGLAKLQSSFVVVVGLGGVGSHCTAGLARSGVSKIRLIDFDQVTLSSLNRHAVATLADVGTPKVQCMRKRLEAVAPWIQWETYNEIWRKEQAERLLGPFGGKTEGGKPDYVVDAIDNIDSKVALLKYCHENGIKVISSMGAGCKSDPTRILVGDISASAEDPLSRATRIQLKRMGISEGIPVVYSIEKPGLGKASLLPLPEEEFQKGGVGELGVLPDFRARILPVLGTMPAVFGYVVANFIIMEITGYPHEAGGGKARDKMYESVLGTLVASEQKLKMAAGEDARGLKIPLTRSDVGYLVDEVFRGKSVLSGLTTRLVLVRWKGPDEELERQANERWKDQKTSSLQMKDLVCMTKEEATIHEQQVLIAKRRPEDVYEVGIVRLVERRLQEEAGYDRYR